jgi:hypothetical protein
MASGLLARGMGHGSRTDAAEAVARDLSQLRRWAVSVREGHQKRRWFPRRDRTPDVRAVLGALGDSQRLLRMDSAAIEQDRTGLRTQILALHGLAFMAEKVDAGLEGAPELQYAARRRREQLLTQLAVALQGYAALKLVADNNRELSAAIDTAMTTTMSALQTADTVGAVLESLDRAERLRAALVASRPGAR